MVTVTSANQRLPSYDLPVQNAISKPSKSITKLLSKRILQLAIYACIPRQLVSSKLVLEMVLEHIICKPVL